MGTRNGTHRQAASSLIVDESANGARPLKKGNKQPYIAPTHNPETEGETNHEPGGLEKRQSQLLWIQSKFLRSSRQRAGQGFLFAYAPPQLPP